MKVLTRDEILGVNDRPTTEEPVPEWEGTILLREPPSTDIEAFQAWCAKHSGGDADEWIGMKARLLSLCIVGENGKPYFAIEDLEAIGSKSDVVLTRLFKKCQKICKLREDDVKEAAGNSESAPSEEPSSG